MRIPTRSKLRAAFVALLLAACAQPAAACSLLGVRGSRFAEETHLIALSSHRTVSAGRGLPRELRNAERPYDWREGLYSPRDREWWRLQVHKAGRRVRRLFRPRLPYGQVVTLERVGGAEAGRIRAALRRSRGEAVLVRWDLGASCGPVLRDERGPWLRPGTRVFLTARLRDRRGWVRGRPTFDVQAGDYPYPRDAQHIGGPVPGERPLPLETYWSLDAWVRANPAAARHRDAREEIEHTRRRLAPDPLWYPPAGVPASSP
jgi:hypothetical protein